MTENKRRFVSYLRVSTKAQEDSGLGLEAQRASVARHVNHDGGSLVAEYRETESGTRCDRPALLDALRHCRMAGAVLVIARLDRLARNLHFFSGLMESGVEFTACDNPTANRLTLHVLAAVYENEARDIAKRTAAGLGAARARGTALGVHALAKDGRKVGEHISLETSLRNLALARRERSRRSAAAKADFRAVLLQMQAAGLSRRRMAEELNAQGYVTRTGKPWTHVQVGRVLNPEPAP